MGIFEGPQKGEARARDLNIAERLGFDRPRNIRKLIERNLAELQRYGVCATMAQTYGTGTKGGRPTEEYWLNEPQALLIAMRSDAELVLAVREMLVQTRHPTPCSNFAVLHAKHLCRFGRPVVLGIFTPSPCAVDEAIVGLSVGSQIGPA
jgi:hypothetical protein